MITFEQHQAKYQREYDAGFGIVETVCVLGADSHTAALADTL